MWNPTFSLFGERANDAPKNKLAVEVASFS